MKKEKKFIEEFKEFISKGNVIDLAVGVVIGTAFGNIVSSLVNDIIMPLIGLLIGNIDFTSLAYTFGKGKNAATIKYGLFIQNIVNFLIISFAIFAVIKFISNFRKKEEDVEVVKDEKLEVLKAIEKELKKKK